MAELMKVRKKNAKSKAKVKKAIVEDDDCAKSSSSHYEEVSTRVSLGSNLNQDNEALDTKEDSSLLAKVESRNTASQKLQDDVLHNDRENTDTKSSLSNFQALNNELHAMAPFYQAQKDLDRLMDNCSQDQADNIEVVTDHKEICDTEVVSNPECKVEPNIIQPFTEMQLLSLYNNQQLEEKDILISEFLEFDCQTNRHEFYEIVLSYLHARASLIGHQKELRVLQKDYVTQQEKVWIFEDQITTEEGTCEDDQLLTVKYEHQVSIFQRNIAKHIGKLLKKIRETVYDQHSLFLYSAELSKLQVENYLQRITACSYFVNLPLNSELPPDYIGERVKFSKEISQLKDCVSVLFSFCRRNVQDHVFVRDVRAWLTDLVAILLRIADVRDHLFVLNHLLRCPTGSGDWASSFIQAPPPKLCRNQDLLGSTLLDHAMVVLAILMEPVKNREKYLQHFKMNPTPVEEDPNDSIWILVDSSGDEEEDVCDMWHLFTENDIIQFLNQVPFEGIFKHVLLLAEDGEDGYIANMSSQHSTLKLFAFCTCLVQIFQKGLSTYAKARYKGVIKRLTRLIRHVVHYATDHLKELITHQRSRCEEEDAAMFCRILVEYDEFFERAIKVVFHSPRSGAWQFLAVIPYSTVSLAKLRQIAYQLHTGYNSDPKGGEAEDYAALLMHPDTRGQFQDHLLRLTDSDAYYLLTALANMAVSRPKEEREFITVLVSSLFDASFLNQDTRELLSRTGRDLLSTIVGAHPFVLSSLMALTQENLQVIGNLSLYLFSFLNYSEWTPTEEDLQCLSYWLLYSPIASLENQLSRIIFERLNWGLADRGGSLFLPRKIHQRVALLVADAFLKASRSLAQGNILSESVKHVTSVMYSPTHEQNFFKWSWSLLNQLRLHQLDQTDLEVQKVMADQRLLLRGVSDPSTTPSFEVIQKGLHSRNPFALFITLLMTSWGHSIPEFCLHGPECLEILVSGGHYEAALTVISLVTPLYFHQHEELTSDAKFVGVLQKLLSSSQSYIGMAKSLLVASAPNGPAELFCSLIMEQVYNYRRFNHANAEAIVGFWTHLLTSISDWRTNKGVLRVIDSLCLHSLFDVRHWQVIKDVLSEQRKDLVKSHSDSRSLGAILTWVTLNPSAPCSLLESTSSPEVPWFALTVHLLECEDQLRSGLWKDLLRNFQEDPSITLEGSLKKTCERLNIEFFNSNYLSIYRLGQQLLSLPCDHPAFPLTLQAFLTLHLTKLPSLPGNFDCSSVIHKLYEGYINGNFLAKIKSKVGQCVEYWTDQLASLKKEVSSTAKFNDSTTDFENMDDMKRIGFLQDLASVLVAMRGWLEEPRIYETGLYLPALPPHLMPDKLLLLFQENWDIWHELIDFEAVCRDEKKLITLWHSQRNRAPCKNAAVTSRSGSLQSIDGAVSKTSCPLKSILKRLKEYDPPKPMPPLPVFRPKIHPIEKNFDRNSIFYDIERYIEIMAVFSHTMYVWSKELCALDCVYLELLPQLWVNQETKTVLTAKCEPPKKSKLSECSGAASIVIEFKEKRLSESVNARLDQNREQHQSVLSQSLHPPPLQLCQGALHLQALVTNVVKRNRSSHLVGSEGDSSFVEFGRKLFYHIVHQTNEETSSFPPAKQLITSSADILGQEFLYSHPDCQKDLVEQVLTWDVTLSGLLSPHFTPLVTPPPVFLGLYASLSPYVASKPDVTFMLLSKFEIETWLKMDSVSAKDKEELLEVIATALTSLLAQRGDEPSRITCLELYRVHLMAIFKENFTKHFPQMLSVLLDISLCVSEDPGGVAESLWFDFLNLIMKGLGRVAPTSTVSEITSCLRVFCHSQTVLSSQLVFETIVTLSTYFVKLRLEHGLYGLYPKFDLHLKPILTLVGLLSFCHLNLSSQGLASGNQEAAINELWSCLEGLWASWISPLGGQTRSFCPKWMQDLIMKRRILLPWTPGDTKGPTLAVGIFSSCVGFFHKTFVGCRILSKYFELYHRTMASAEVPSYVLSVVHLQMSPLPWHRLHPSLKDVEIFSKIINEYLPDCHSFVGGIFIQIPWNEVVRETLTKAGVKVDSVKPDSELEVQLASVDKNSDVVKLHVSLLGILVRISMEPSVRQSGLLHPLLISAESFAWEFLDGQKYETILNWFVMGCDPRVVLNMDSRNPVDVSLIQLLHVAAGYMPRLTPHPDAPMKRRLLVRALVRLLMTSSTRHKALLRSQPALFRTTYAIWLSHMEDVVVELPLDRQYSEGLVLACEVVLAVGGGASPPPLQEACRDAMLQWLSGHHPTQTFLLALAAAVSRGVLLMHHRSALLEGCLSAIHCQAGSCSKMQRLSWSDLVAALSFPVTNPMPMLSFAAQENHLLLIYAHTRWRLRIRDVSVEDEETILANLLEILQLICPEESCEKGLLLIVHEILKLIQAQVERKETLLSAWKHTRRLADHLFAWGEDRATVGILAAIGLGRKSPLSVSIRLIFKSLSTFLAGQLVSPGSFSIINERVTDLEGEDSSDDSLKALRAFTSLRSNAQYSDVRTVLDHAITFIQDCCHSVLDAPTLSSDLAFMLFPKDRILDPMFLKSKSPSREFGNDETSLLNSPQGEDVGFSPSAPPCFESFQD